MCLDFSDIQVESLTSKLCTTEGSDLMYDFDLIWVVLL